MHSVLPYIGTWSISHTLTREEVRLAFLAGVSSREGDGGEPSLQIIPLALPQEV